MYGVVVGSWAVVRGPPEESVCFNRLCRICMYKYIYIYIHIYIYIYIAALWGFLGFDFPQLGFAPCNRRSLA